MTSGQRKAHKFVWLSLTILMPIVMFFSIKDLDVSSSTKSNVPQLETSNDNILKFAENDLIKASLFESHIELVLKTTLKNPTSIVYEMDQSGNKTTAIGQLTTAGFYEFNIKELPNGILLHDAFKNKTITKLTF